MKPLRTATGDLVKVERWKDWFKVTVQSGTATYTAYQSKIRAAAIDYMCRNYDFPCTNANLGTWTVPDKGQVLRRINIYP